MTIELTRSALLDCQEIISIGQLESFPESGRIVPEFQLPELRELIEPPFRIVYRITERSLTVIRIWRGERLLALPE